MTLQLHDLSLLEDPFKSLQGVPLQIEIGLIDEDPQQPRTLFEGATLAELASSIRERGVLQPISVRQHPAARGRWILNFGARRLRASRLASLERIPAFVDDTADDYAQVVENEQRERLKPLELALFVQRRMAVGDSQAEIARRIGKSRPYITYATALIDAPDWLMNAYREGRCRGLSDLYELRNLESARPDVVARWMSDGISITRERMDALRSEIKTEASVEPAAQTAMTLVESPPSPSPPLVQGTCPTGTCAASTLSQAPATISQIARTARSSSGPRLLLRAEHEGKVVMVVLDEAPLDRAQMYVQTERAGDRTAVPAGSLTLLGFVEQ